MLQQTQDQYSQNMR